MENKNENLVPTVCFQVSYVVFIAKLPREERAALGNASRSGSYAFIVLSKHCPDSCTA